jgi:hypothetical protein
MTISGNLTKVSSSPTGPVYGTLHLTYKFSKGSYFTFHLWVGKWLFILCACLISLNTSQSMFIHVVTGHRMSYVKWLSIFPLHMYHNYYIIPTHLLMSMGWIHISLMVNNAAVNRVQFKSITLMTGQRDLSWAYYFSYAGQSPSLFL